MLRNHDLKIGQSVTAAGKKDSIGETSVASRRSESFRENPRLLRVPSVITRSRYCVTCMHYAHTTREKRYVLRRTINSAPRRVILSFLITRCTNDNSTDFRNIYIIDFFQDINIW